MDPLIKRLFSIKSKAIIAKMNLIGISDSSAVTCAVELLKHGSVVAVPTDTIYGFACSATNIAGINRIFEIKKRDEHKPVALCVGKSSDIKKWAKVSHLPEGLLDSLLPGPVTLVLPCTKKLNPLLISNGYKVGIRIPDYSFIVKVANELGSPIALTSANLSGEPSSVNVDDFKKLWTELSAVFDGGTVGQSCNRSGSTVVDLCEAGYYHIIREGVAEERTKNILNQFGLITS